MRHRLKRALASAIREAKKLLTDALLLENGSALLLEGGDYLRTEA